MRDYYRILEIDKSATLSQIKLAYRRLSKLYHPDLNPHNIHSAEMFKLITEAYSTLSDPTERSAYDKRLNLAYNKSDNNYQKYTRDSKKNKEEEDKEHFSNENYWEQSAPTAYSGYNFNDENIILKDSDRIPNIYSIWFLIDICFGIYFIHYINRLDLSKIPQVYHLYGKFSWLAHLKTAIWSMKVSVFLSLLQLLSPLIQKISVSIKIFIRFRYKDIKFIICQTFLKILIALLCVSPMFGMGQFDLSGTIFIYIILWNVFIALSLIYIVVRLQDKD
jgi:DnaJ domain